MTKLTANSDTSLQNMLGFIREQYNIHKYVRADIKTGKDRSLPQNNFIHAWYQQLARELKEDNALGWKCYCKLHHGVPILRAESDEFLETYDIAIKPLDYDVKLLIMREWPVTSIMTKEQLTQYAESVRIDFHRRGIILEVKKES